MLADSVLAASETQARDSERHKRTGVRKRVRSERASERL